MITTQFRPVFIDSFPTALKAGTFYISLEYSTCAHLCACGCGEEAVTPLSPEQWAFTYDGETISVRPSIGNWTLACRSHYVINKGRVRWAKSFSNAQITNNRERDRAALDRGNRNGFHIEPDSGETTAAESDDKPKGRVRRWWHRLLG